MGRGKVCDELERRYFLDNVWTHLRSTYAFCYGSNLKESPVQIDRLLEHKTLLMGMIGFLQRSITQNSMQAIVLQCVMPEWKVGDRAWSKTTAARLRTALCHIFIALGKKEKAVLGEGMHEER